MTRTGKLALLLLAVASAGTGCRNFDTPRSLRGTPKPDDPMYGTREYGGASGNSIAEQERRGRARFGIGEDDFRVGPKTYSDRPDPVSGGVR